jgi:hypothetical protein
LTRVIAVEIKWVVCWLHVRFLLQWFYKYKLLVILFFYIKSISWVWLFRSDFTFKKFFKRFKLRNQNCCAWWMRVIAIFNWLSLLKNTYAPSFLSVMKDNFTTHTQGKQIMNHWNCLSSTIFTPRKADALLWKAIKSLLCIFSW